MPADGLWDWPNEQVVRVDQSGPGVDTRSPNPFITYGHDGLSYEFLVFTSSGMVGGPVAWTFGDGSTATVDGLSPATHTYAAAGPYTVTASAFGITTTLDVTAEVVGIEPLRVQPHEAEPVEVEG